jgi:hypothetical protein
LSKTTGGFVAVSGTRIGGFKVTTMVVTRRSPDALVAVKSTV